MTDRPVNEGENRELEALEQTAEANLAAAISAVDVSDPSACSPRANAFKAMQENWNAWDDGDPRWWAVLEILHKSDHPDLSKARHEGIDACAIAAYVIGGAGDLACGIPDEVQLRRLEAAVTRLAAVAALFRLAECADPDNDEARAEILNG